MKKKSVIAGAVAAGIFLLLIILCISAAANPKNLVAGALTNTSNDISKIYVVDYAGKLLNGGSVTVSCNTEKFSGKDADAELKVYTDFSRMRFAASGKIKEGRNVAASFSGAFNGKDISVESPLISKKPYGVSLRNLSNNLPKSVFNPETGDEDLKLNKNVYEYLTKLYNTVSSDKALANESKKLTRDYERRLVNALLDHARITTGSEKISAGGKQLNCTVVTLDFDRKSLEDAVSELVSYAKHDKNLESYLLKVYSNYDYGIKDADDKVDDFYDRLDAFKRSVKDYDGDMTIWLYITKSGKRIARINVDTDGKNKRGTRIAYEMSLELGKNVRNSEEISFTLDTSEGRSLDLAYSVRQNDKLAYKASVSYKTGTRTLKREQTISFKWDKKGGGYTLTKDKNGNITNYEGKLTQRGDAYTFSLENIDWSYNKKGFSESDSTSYADYNLKITFDRTDRGFNPSRYIEITKMSAEEIKSLRNDVTNAYKDVKDTWFTKH